MFLRETLASLSGLRPGASWCRCRSGGRVALCGGPHAGLLEAGSARRNHVVEGRVDWIAERVVTTKVLLVPVLFELKS